MLGGKLPYLYTIEIQQLLFGLGPVLGSMKNTKASHNGKPDLKSLQYPWEDKNNINN